uniref:Uncharacterized protein n=1 Tax=Ciona savignyi TaxID=51511 RepID=H2YN59_CIOSA
MSSSPVTNKTVNERYSKLSETLKKLTVDSPDVDGTENLKDTEKKKQIGTDENLDIQMHLSRTEIPKSNGVISLDKEVESESESEEEDSSDEDDDPITAPLELMGEFLQYIRQGKWEDAKKLCVMILIYEPSNVEALQFQPVIDAKIQVSKSLQR